MMFQAKIIDESENLSYQDHLKLAETAFNKKDYLAASEHYQIGIWLYLKDPKIDHSTFIPLYAGLQQNLGLAFYELEKYSEAQKAFGKAIELEPLNAIHYFNVGNLFFKRNKHTEAIIFYEKTIALKPDYFEAHSNLGGLYLIQKDLQNAKKYFKQALALNPKDQYALENMKLIIRDESQLKHFKARVNAERRRQFQYL